MGSGEYKELLGRKVLVTRFGGPEVLQLAPHVVSAPPPGHARVRVLASGIGRTDLMARAGDYFVQREVPFTPGYDLAGEVIDCEGDDADRLRPGMLVAAALSHMAAYADYVVLPSWLLVPLPDGLAPNVAATIPLDYLTALSILDTHAQVRAGDAVLIQGAAGNVGQALCQLGRRKELRMYGTASARDAQLLVRCGVHFIDYSRQDFAATIRDLEPEGVQAVFDVTGGANIDKGYELLAPGGTLVSYGFTGRPGHMVEDTERDVIRLMELNELPGKHTAIVASLREAESDHAWYQRSLQQLLQMAQSGEITPPVAVTFPLDQAADAHRARESKEISGKAVLTTV